jgi:hypothetical protein
MADALPPLTGIVEATPVAGLPDIPVEDPSQPSMASDGFPRDLFEGLLDGDSHNIPTPAPAGEVMDLPTCPGGDVLPPETILHVHGRTPNKDTPVSDLTAPSGPALSPDSIISPKTRQMKNFESLEPKFMDGYDSDGGEAPALPDEDFDEPPIMERQSDGVEIMVDSEEIEAEISENSPREQPRHLPIEEDALKKMTVAAIKHELRIREVQYISTLKKTELLERLRQALNRKVKVSIFGTISTDKVPAKKKSSKAVVNDMAGFAPGAYWEQLNAIEEPVEEPLNTIRNARAPTVDADAKVPVKHDFAETFDRPIFEGKVQVQKMHNNNKKMFDKDGTPIMTTAQRQHITPRQDFLLKHNLTRSSDPVEYANAFFPWKENPYNPALLSMGMLTTYTNLKAKLANAGPGGVCYPDWKDFTVDELRQHIGLYVWNGLSPSPRLEMKLQPQHIDPINGNDFIHRHMGPNAIRRHKHFRAFFACQDPRIDPPCRKKAPLFKVRPLIKWLNYIGQSSVKLGMHASVDEQTIGFQGRHADKLRITYKAEGDGFQADCICENGFTYALHFRNEPPPTKYTSRGLSPLHARVMWLFDHLTDRYHRIWMDNLYLSSKFVKAAYLHKNKVMIAGVTRKAGRGLPLSVLQEEEKNKTKQEALRGTVKVSVLKGDPDCPAMVAASVYDTKPVHFLSMMCESIQWVVKERLVYNVETEMMEVLRFLRLNVNDFYNINMGHVDVSDQLRNTYRFDHWLRQWKWWWSVWLWSLGVMLVNAYTTYQMVMKQAGVPRRQWQSQYEFRRAIALAWVSSDEPTIAARRKSRDERVRQRAEYLAATGQETTSGSQVTGKRGRATSSIDTSKRSRRKTTAPEATTNNNKERAPTLKDNLLQLKSGPLSERLSRAVGHFPTRLLERGARCAVHRWAAAIEVKADVYKCSHCRINLCVDCFELFHCKIDLVAHKQNLRDKMTKDKQPAANAKSAPTVFGKKPTKK